MACPHSRSGSPTSCSICLGAAARVVTIESGMVLVDGEAERPNVEPVPVQVETARRRGGKVSRVP